MPVSVEQVTEGFRFIIIEAQDWFRKETSDERDEEIFFWPWIEKAPPQVDELSGITEEEFYRTLSEWLAKFKAATAVYLKAKALAEKGVCGSFDIGYGLKLEIESAASRFAPSFLRQTAGYSYGAEYFEMLIEKLEAWILSVSGFGAELPYSDFWTWFKATKVYEKFSKLEAEIEELFTGGNGSDDRKRLEDLARKWDESLRWAITEFHGTFSRT